MMPELPADIRDWPAEARTDLTERAAIWAGSVLGDPAAELSRLQRELVVGLVRRDWPNWGGRAQQKDGPESGS